MDARAEIIDRFFRLLCEERLDEEHRERALEVFHNYGQRREFDIINVVLQAVYQGKVGEVLEIMGRHWDEYLRPMHPRDRGTGGSDFLPSPTTEMFMRIFTQTLGLQPQE